MWERGENDGDIQAEKSVVGNGRTGYGGEMIKKGDRVIYALSGPDALAINRRRTNGPSIAARMKIRVRGEHEAHQGTLPVPVIYGWPEGAQAHIGNTVREGQTFPGVVVEDWSRPGETNDPARGDIPCVANLQVWLDGTDTLWVTSVEEGDGPGLYRRQH